MNLVSTFIFKINSKSYIETSVRIVQFHISEEIKMALMKCAASEIAFKQSAKNASQYISIRSILIFAPTMPALRKMHAWLRVTSNEKEK